MRLNNTIIVGAIGGLLIAGQASADVQITDRTSTMQFYITAGAGSQSDTYDVGVLSESSLSAPFDRDDAYNAFVNNTTISLPGSSRCDATTSGEDVIVPGNTGALRIESSQGGWVEAEHLSGSGVANGLSGHSTIIKFDVTGAPVDYRIYGNFAPGEATGQVELKEGFNLEFRLTTVLNDPDQPYNHSGTLDPASCQIKQTLNVFAQALTPNNPPTFDDEIGSLGFVLTFCPADANGDGAIDVNDISFVLFRLGTTDIEADVNADDVVDVNDISYVLFRLGDLCP